MHNGVMNSILSALPADAHARLTRHLGETPLKRGDVLHEPGRPVQNVHFPLEGVISHLAVMADGAATEVGMVGPEGIVGAGALSNGGHAVTRALVIVPGRAMSISADTLRGLLDELPDLREAIALFQQNQIRHSQQVAACNLLHKIDNRLCRWLLQVADRARNNAVPVTQDLLAQLLGVHRGTLNEASAHLRAEGMITDTRRGWVEIAARDKVERCACECYAKTRPTEPVAHKAPQLATAS